MGKERKGKEREGDTNDKRRERYFTFTYKENNISPILI